GLGDSGYDAVDVLLGDGIEKSKVEPGADALSRGRLAAGDAGFHGCVVCFFRPEPSGCGISQDCALGIRGDDHAAPASVTMLLKPREPLLRCKWTHIECDVGIQDVVILDVYNPGQVGNRARADYDVTHGLCCG